MARSCKGICVRYECPKTSNGLRYMLGYKASFTFYDPNFKQTLKNAYKHDPDFLEELSKIYGKLT